MRFVCFLFQRPSVGCAGSALPVRPINYREAVETEHTHRHRGALHTFRIRHMYNGADATNAWSGAALSLFIRKASRGYRSSSSGLLRCHGNVQKF